MPQRILLIAENESSEVRQQAQWGDAEVTWAENCAKAREILSAGGSEFDRVVTETTLKDGNWCDVLRILVQRSIQADLEVFCPKPGSRFQFEIKARGVRLATDAGSLHAFQQTGRRAAAAGGSIEGAK